jgi:hypothetical protein
MSRKMYALLLPVLAIAAMAMTAGAAQAAPHWFVCEKGGTEKFETNQCAKKSAAGTFSWKLAGTAHVKVKTHTTALTLHALGITITCEVKDSGAIWNPAGGGAGEDEITVFTNENCVSSEPAVCSTPTIKPLGLPWKTLLLTVTPIRDEIKGVKVEVLCSGSSAGVFEGNLTPKIVNGSPTVAEFGTGSGELEEATRHLKATVTGSDAIEGESGEAVKAE